MCCTIKDMPCAGSVSHICRLIVMEHSSMCESKILMGTNWLIPGQALQVFAGQNRLLLSTWASL